MRLQDAEPGQRVLYVPRHAYGVLDHPDVERGMVSTVGNRFVHVRFDGENNSKACDPADLVPESYIAAAHKNGRGGADTAAEEATAGGADTAPSQPDLIHPSPPRQEMKGDQSAPATFRQWAIVEIMGHRHFAGLVTEQTIAGAAFVRVDVPAVDGREAFTKLFGASSIYCLTPCTEETARAFAVQWRSVPLAEYSLPRLPARDRQPSFLSGPEDDSDIYHETDEL